jgi:hypothetical protein
MSEPSVASIMISALRQAATALIIAADQLEQLPLVPVAPVPEGKLEVSVRDLQVLMAYFRHIPPAQGLQPDTAGVQQFVILLMLQTVEAFNQNIADVLGPSRKREVMEARHAVMWLLHRETDLNYSEIARLLGRQDHTTAKHGIQRIENGVEDIKTRLIRIAAMARLQVYSSH